MRIECEHDEQFLTLDAARTHTSYISLTGDERETVDELVDAIKWLAALCRRRPDRSARFRDAVVDCLGESSRRLVIEFAEEVGRREAELARQRLRD